MTQPTELETYKNQVLDTLLRLKRDLNWTEQYFQDLVDELALPYIRVGKWWETYVFPNGTALKLVGRNFLIVKYPNHWSLSWPETVKSFETLHELVAALLLLVGGPISKGDFLTINLQNATDTWKPLA